MVTKKQKQTQMGGGGRGSVLALALVLVCSSTAGVDGAKYSGTIKSPESWVYLGKFCFLPANNAKVQGMIKTEFKFKLNSHFTLLHYTTGKTHVKGSDHSLNSWENTYKSRSTCIERVKNPLAFPFYLAEIARRYAAPPPPASTGGGGGGGKKKLLQSIFSFDDYEEEVDFDIDGQRITVDLSKSLQPNHYQSLKLNRYSGFKIPLSNLPNSSCRYASEGTVNQGGLGLIDIGASNTKDAFTKSPLDAGALLRFHDDGYVEIIRTTFYVGDRPRFFFIAGANCYRFCASENCDGPVDISYNITFLNGYNFNDKHFSADEIGVLETMLTFVCLQFCLLIFFAYVRFQLKEIDKYHHTVKMLGASISLAFSAHLWFAVHYLVYAANGVGFPFLMFAGRITQGASETVFMLTLIMLAKGWTICCRKISAKGRVKIAVFGTFYACIWIAVPIGYYEYSDKASTLHIYQSSWGYVLCGLRAFGLLWFCYSCHRTLSKYNAKVHFYRKFVAAFSLWFVGLPVTVCVAFALEPWMRFLIVNAIDYSFLYLFQLVLLLMYNPSTVFNKSFPFHATTLDASASNAPKVMMRKGVLPIAASGSKGGAAADENGADAVVKSFGNTVFQKNILSSKWDQREFARAMQHARAVMREGKLLLECLESIEASNEDEDEDYSTDEQPRSHRESNNNRIFSRKTSTPPESRAAAAVRSNDAKGAFGSGVFGASISLPASLRSRMFGGTVKHGGSSLRPAAEPAATAVSGLGHVNGGSTVDPTSTFVAGDGFANNLDTKPPSRAFVDTNSHEPLRLSSSSSLSPRNGGSTVDPAGTFAAGDGFANNLDTKPPSRAFVDTNSHEPLRLSSSSSLSPRKERQPRLPLKAELSSPPPQLPKLQIRNSLGDAIDPLGGGFLRSSTSPRISPFSAHSSAEADEEEGRTGFGSLGGGVSSRPSSMGRSSYT